MDDFTYLFQSVDKVLRENIHQEPILKIDSDNKRIFYTYKHFGFMVQIVVISLPYHMFTCSVRKNKESRRTLGDRIDYGNAANFTSQKMVPYISKQFEQYFQYLDFIDSGQNTIENIHVFPIERTFLNNLEYQKQLV